MADFVTELNEGSLNRNYIANWASANLISADEN
jgi:hypothetical protein